MISTKLLVFVATAFVMVPHAGGLKATQPGQLEEKRGFGFFDASEVMKRGLTFSARNAEQSEFATQVVDFHSPHPVAVKLVNDGDRPFTFFKRGTPFEEQVTSKILRSMPTTSTFLGKVVGRELKTPPKDSLITLNPGEEISSTIDVNQLMAFHEEGDYQMFVDFAVVEFDSKEDTRPVANATQSFISAEFHLNVQDGERKATRTKAEIQGKFDHKEPGLYGCSAAQGEALVKAVTDANEMLDFAIGQMERKENAQRYMGWLGADEACELWDGHPRLMLESVKRTILGGFVAECGQCAQEMGDQADTTYAYVYPADPTQTLHMCGAFFTAPDRDDGIRLKRSQPGAIIYELLHFHEYAVYDVPVGTGGLRDIAKQNPCMAQHNAENLAAYAEYAKGINLKEVEKS